MAASNSYSSADAITLESQLLLIMAASNSYSADAITLESQLLLIMAASNSYSSADAITL